MAEQHQSENKVEESKKEEEEKGHLPTMFLDQSSIQRLLCFLCKWVAKEAVELSCSQHENDDSSAVVFCKRCLEKFIETSKTCPISKHENPTFEKSGYMRKEVMNSKVKCQRAVEQTKSAFTSITNSSKALSSSLSLFATVL